MTRSAPSSAGHLQNRLDRITARTGIDDLRGTELHCRSLAPMGESGRSRSPAPPCRSPQPPLTQDRWCRRRRSTTVSLASVPPETPHGVEAAGKGLDERGRAVIDRIGQFVQPFGPHDEIFAIRAIQRKTEMMHCGRATCTTHSPTTRFHRPSKIPHIAPDFHDLAAPFVTRRHRIADRNDVAAAKQLVIGVANPHGPQTHQDPRSP